MLQGVNDYPRCKPLENRTNNCCVHWPTLEGSFAPHTSYSRQQKNESHCGCIEQRYDSINKILLSFQFHVLKGQCKQRYSLIKILQPMWSRCYIPTQAFFPLGSLSNGQTKTWVWINSQRHRVLSKIYLIRLGLQYWMGKLTGTVGFLVILIFGHARNTIRTIPLLQPEAESKERTINVGEFNKHFQTSKLELGLWLIRRAPGSGL